MDGLAASLLIDASLHCGLSSAIVYVLRQRQSYPTCKVLWRGRKKISITSTMLMVLEMTSLNWPGYTPLL